MKITRKQVLASTAGLAAMAAVALTGCSSSGSSGGSTSAKTSSITLFNGSVGNFTENFNPFNNTGAALQPTLGTIYEPLFYYDIARTQAPVPLLGTKYQWNSAGTQLTITVRQGVKWNNGTNMSAADVAYTLNRYESTPAMNTLGTTWTTKQDGDNVVLTFPAPSFTLEPNILGNIPIVPKAVWSHISNVFKTTNTTPVGTGPYMVDKFTPQSYTLKKNPYYWGTGKNKPKIDELRYISLSNADAATSALESGQVDWMGSFLPTMKNIAQTHKNVTYVLSPNSTTSLMTCSNAAMGCTGPQTDPAVRQAMYYAMDRAQMQKQAEDGFSTNGSASALVPATNSQWIVPSEASLPQSANVAKAKSILKADGWQLNSKGYFEKNGQELDLSVNVVSGWTDYDTDTTLLQGQFKAAGINLTVNNVAQNVWSSAEASGKYELSVNSVNPGASTSPYYIYENYLSPAGTAKVGQNASTNTTRFSNATVTSILNKLRTTNPADTAAFKQGYSQIQSILMQDMPFIPMYANTAMTEFSTAHATGWPSQGDQYAFPEPYKAWDSGIVLKNLTPVTNSK